MGACLSSDPSFRADGTNMSAGQAVPAAGANDTPMGAGGGSWSATSPEDRRVLVLEEYTSQVIVKCSACVERRIFRFMVRCL